MKIILTPNFGKVVHYDFCLTEVTAEVSNTEHIEALESGFLMLQGKWRLCRSTRVDLRHRFFWDGGLHCVTSDVNREGPQLEYFDENHASMKGDAPV